VGAVTLVEPGREVREGDPLLELHHRNGAGLHAALALCGEAVVIGDAPPPRRPIVLGEVR
jgi:thymidine phosphorylase